MAIKHLRILARKLAEKYNQIQDICTKFAEITAESCLSDEDFQEYAKVRSQVDAESSLLSVSLSSALSDSKFSSLTAQAALPVKQFTKELNNLLLDLDKPGSPAQTRDIADLYTTQLQTALRTADIINMIGFYKNLQNKVKKLKKNAQPFLLSGGYSIEEIKQASLTSLVEMCLTIINPFEDLDKQIINFSRYLEGADIHIESTAGDLDE